MNINSIILFKKRLKNFIAEIYFKDKDDIQVVSQHPVQKHEHSLLINVF